MRNSVRARRAPPSAIPFRCRGYVTRAIRAVIGTLLETHRQAAELHDEAAVLHDEHAEEIEARDWPLSRERARGLVDRDRLLAEMERRLHEDSKRKAEESSE